MTREDQPAAIPGGVDEAAAASAAIHSPVADAVVSGGAGSPLPSAFGDGLVREELGEPGPEPDYTGDRWAHRRAEPRPLAFMWTLYLFAATAMTFAAIRGVGGLTLDVYHPALRVLLMTVAAGVVVVWPMIRLSQAGPPEHPASAALKDLFAIVVPLQAIVWPQWALTGWPVSVIGAVAGTLTAWAVLTCGLLAIYFRVEPAQAEESPPGGFGSRAMMTLVFVLLAALGPVVGAAWSLLGGTTTPARTSWWMLSSPLTAIFDITADRAAGPVLRGVPAHWAVAANVAVAGVVCWFWSLTPRRRAPGRVTS